MKNKKSISKWIKAMDKPVARRLTGYEIVPIHDVSGEAIQIIYEYETDSGNYDSLTVDMDLTIGPCTDYWNAQESNVIPSVIPELVGNYHFSFQVPVKISTPSAILSLTLRSTAMDRWRDLPIFPGGIETNDTATDYPIYHYIIENADIDSVQRFYKSQMQVIGWELLNVGDMSGADIGKAYALWFTKDQDIVIIDVSVKENVTHVIITLE